LFQSAKEPDVTGIKPINPVLIFTGGVGITKKSPQQMALFRRREIRIIYQFYNLIPVLNAKENITLPLELDNRQIDKDSSTCSLFVF
jgi:ABC-type lipoprotein export system ATPase subunit